MRRAGRYTGGPIKGQDTMTDNYDQHGGPTIADPATAQELLFINIAVARALAGLYEATATILGVRPSDESVAALHALEEAQRTLDRILPETPPN